MFFLDEAYIHQVDMKLLRSKGSLVLHEVFLDKVCISPG